MRALRPITLVEVVFNTLFTWRCLPQLSSIHVKTGCYQFRFHCWFASNLKWSSSKQVFSACVSSFDIVERIEHSFKLFLSIFKLENVRLLFFKWKWILIGLQGFIDRVWQNNFASTSRYGVQNRLRPLLEPAIISIFEHRYLHGW